MSGEELSGKEAYTPRRGEGSGLPDYRSLTTFLPHVLRTIEELVAKKGYVNPYQLSAEAGISWTRAKRWLDLLATLGAWRYIVVEDRRKNNYSVRKISRICGVRTKRVLEEDKETEEKHWADNY